MPVKSSAIIAAAGSSRRMEGRDKLWTPLAGRITLARTIDVFEASPIIDNIVLVLNSERLDDVTKLCQQEGWSKITSIVVGGMRRQDSVRSGLDNLAKFAPTTQWVMIHDAYQTAPLEQEFTDDAGLLEYLGKRVSIFNGSYRNIKITTQEDLLIAEALIKGLAAT